LNLDVLFIFFLNQNLVFFLGQADSFKVAAAATTGSPSGGHIPTNNLRRLQRLDTCLSINATENHTLGPGDFYMPTGNSLSQTVITEKSGEEMEVEEKIFKTKFKSGMFSQSKHQVGMY
jgi:hypothetical protein